MPYDNRMVSALRALRQRAGRAAVFSNDPTLLFWKEDAKLAILNPETRMKSWIAVLGTVAGLVALFFFGGAVGMSTLAARSTSIFLAVLMFPLTIAMDLYFKGADVGLKLKAENARLDKEVRNDGDRRAAALALTETRQQLGLIRNYGVGSVPQPSTEGNYAERVMQFTLTLRARVVACIESCNERTDIIPKASLEVDSIRPLINHVEILHKIDDRLEMIETIQKTL